MPLPIQKSGFMNYCIVFKIDVSIYYFCSVFPVYAQESKPHYLFFLWLVFFFLHTIETSSTGAAFKDILKHENNHITAFQLQEKSYWVIFALNSVEKNHCMTESSVVMEPLN